MKVWKILFFVGLSLLVISNLFWIYIAIDAGISQTYQKETLEEKQKAVIVLGDLIVKYGQNYSKKDILHILRQYRSEALIVDSGEYIDFDGIKFYFADEKLIKIEG